jgi:hypothetical protein
MRYVGQIRIARKEKKVIWRLHLKANLRKIPTFSHYRSYLEYIRAQSRIKCRGLLDCVGTDGRKELRKELWDLNGIGSALIDKNCPFEGISNGLQKFLNGKSPSAAHPNSAREWHRTTLSFPCCKSSVGLAVMKVPSTTGLNTKVPKKPLLLISVLTV